ncbi:hypothetical protein [Psychrobacillus sp. FSL K6-1267]|uniref:hypothetical protein n=1 Tax=Psychrobacillus sp. FSL K6-1267 TaxID=2921543 RepID=UPI0030F798C1
MQSKNNEKFIEQPNLGLTLGFLGSVFETLGLLIGTIGEGVILQEMVEEEQVEKKIRSDQKNQLSQIEKKLDYVIKELELLKR